MDAVHFDHLTDLKTVHAAHLFLHNVMQADLDNRNFVIETLKVIRTLRAVTDGHHKTTKPTLPYDEFERLHPFYAFYGLPFLSIHSALEFSVCLHISNP